MQHTLSCLDSPLRAWWPQLRRPAEQLRTTEAVFVAAQRGWRIGIPASVTGAARAALLPSFAMMLGTFRLR